MALPYTHTNGDVIDADETNANLTYVDPWTAKFSSNGEVNGDGIDFKTVTIGGGYSGDRLIFVSFQAKLSSTSDYAWIDVKKGSAVVNQTYSASGTHTFMLNVSSYTDFAVPIMVANGDVITVVVTKNGGSITEYVKNFRVYGGNSEITYT